MTKIFKKIFWFFGIYLSSKKSYEKLIVESKQANEILQLTLKIHNINENYAKAQLGQDLIALLVNKFKHNGYFVEFGATNGCDLSNSYLLEKKFNWSGILAEPMPRWHKELFKNRKNSLVDRRCVWSLSGEILDFLDVEDGELSTIVRYANSDNHANERKNSKTIKVKTISLLDLLKFHGAPKVIDYLSVDTEGSELEILSNFPFNEYRFNFISIEHNYGPNRYLLINLMKKNGYKQILKGLSKWDDWFVAS